MSKLAKTIFILLLAVLLFEPFMVPEHVGAIHGSFDELMITTFLIFFALLIYYLQEKDIDSKESELKNSTQKLLESFKYIGSTNRKLSLLKGFTSDLLKNPKISKKDKALIFEKLLSSAVISVVKVEWGVFRFINVKSFNTEKEFIYTSKGCRTDCQITKNKELLSYDAHHSPCKLYKDFWVFPTTDKDAIIRGYLILPESEDSLDDEISLLQSIIDQAQLFYKYLY